MRLTGMMQIKDYFNYSETTILKLVRESDFPARKISGGIWESDTELIDAWRKDQIMLKSGYRPPQKKKYK
jgi:hypothetical protein